MITDFETWILDVGFDRTFRMLEYRRVGDWTPLEMEKKWMDQSQYKDNHYTLIRIKEAIELPDGDILLGYIDVTDAVALNILEEVVLEPGGTGRLRDFMPVPEDEIDAAL